MTPRQRQFAAAAAAVAALLAGATLALLKQRTPAGPQSATVYNEPRPLPAFRLIGQDGEPVSREALRGRWSWLFFGFTHCPDVCPTTLAVLARAVERVPEDARPEVFLVSVDPERDSAPVLARYVAHFDPDFRALTGPRDEIDAFAEALYVAHARIPQGDTYTVDHFSGVFLVDPEARIVAVTTPPHDAAGIASDYLALRRARR